MPFVGYVMVRWKTSANITALILKWFCNFAVFFYRIFFYRIIEFADPACSLAWYDLQGFKEKWRSPVVLAPNGNCINYKTKSCCFYARIKIYKWYNLFKKVSPIKLVWGIFELVDFRRKKSIEIDNFFQKYFEGINTTNFKLHLMHLLNVTSTFTILFRFKMCQTLWPVEVSS